MRLVRVEVKNRRAFLWGWNGVITEFVGWWNGTKKAALRLPGRGLFGSLCFCPKMGDFERWTDRWTDKLDGHLEVKWTDRFAFLGYK